MQQPELTPFACRFSPQVPELLMKLQCSLAITTYQAGKLLFISPKDENNLIQLPRTFDKPMGVGFSSDHQKMVLALKDQVMVLANSKDLATHYPKKPQTYDNLFLPRMSYYTGPLDLHDVSFGADEKIYAVNTLFSCLIELDSNYNYKPYWKPKFVDAYVSEDRCHLNGMILKDGKPKYVTAFSQGNTPQSWRETLIETGCIIDVETDEVICDGLAMPHSPKLINGKIYVLTSGNGKLVQVDPTTGKKVTILKTDSFVRGMDLHKDHLFIGTSKLRQNSSTFNKLDIAKTASEAEILIYHLPTASFVGKISYLNSLDEIYDLKVLPDMMRPNVLNTIRPDHKEALSTPESTFWARKKESV